MTFDEEFAEAGQRSTSGPLERAAFRSDDSGEKSLLELIEERSAEKLNDGTSEHQARPQDDSSRRQRLLSS
jgi:hypothetical protein